MRRCLVWMDWLIRRNTLFLMSKSTMPLGLLSLLARVLGCAKQTWSMHLSTFYGAKWHDKYYFYTRLAFGSRSSPKIFDWLSSAITWILQNKFNLTHTLHLLDDFLVINHPADDADRSMAVNTMVSRRRGLPIAPHRSVGPVHAPEYLGIILDTVKMEAMLPEDK